MLRRPTRLELHRIKYAHSKSGIDLLSFDELDVDERKLLSEAFFMELKLRPSDDPYVVYSDVIASWGVMCNHPNSRRAPLSEHGYVCGSCNSLVMGDVVPGQQLLWAGLR